MNDMTDTHYEIKKHINSYGVSFCGGRSDRLIGVLTKDRTLVTCNRCLQKLKRWDEEKIKMHFSKSNSNETACGRVDGDYQVTQNSTLVTCHFCINSVMRHLANKRAKIRVKAAQIASEQWAIKNAVESRKLTC